DIGGGWPLRGAQPDATGYISELANTSNVNHKSSGSRDRLFIAEEEEVEGELEDDDAVTLRDGEEFEVRESMQTERGSTRKSLS
ncbi:MAG: hypothetical protein Q9181_007622, partial [Wetmoreana brouardii]